MADVGGVPYLMPLVQRDKVIVPRGIRRKAMTGVEQVLTLKDGGRQSLHQTK